MMLTIIVAWVVTALAQVASAPTCLGCGCCAVSVCQSAAAAKKTCIEVDASEPRHLGCPCSYQWERLR